MWRSIGRIDRLSKALIFREIDPEKLDIFDLKRTLRGKANVYDIVQ